MKQHNVLKPLGLLLLLLLLTVMVAPVAAQEPEGEVNIQVNFAAFLWNPAATTVSRGDGTVLTKFNVQGAEDISGFTFAVAYDASVVSPESVQPGSLLPGTRGVDYLMAVIPGGGGLACGGDTSFTVNVVYFDPTVSINGTGDLFQVVWRSDPDAAVGNVANVCVDGATSLIVDNGGFPGLAIPNTAGTITIEPLNIFKFQIGLEGGEPSSWAIGAVPDFIFTEVTINGFLPCAVDALGFCAFNNPLVSPPYTVAVSRLGYLDVETSFADPHDSATVFLTAGDLNDDNVVNIFDLALMAGVFGAPVGPDTLSNIADYTGPVPAGVAPAPNGVIDITDLVLVAKNFGKAGPTEGETPPGGGGGTFPF